MVCKIHINNNEIILSTCHHYNGDNNRTSYIEDTNELCFTTCTEVAPWILIIVTMQNTTLNEEIMHPCILTIIKLYNTTVTDKAEKVQYSLNYV